MRSLLIFQVSLFVVLSCAACEPRLNPNFSITKNELAQMVGSLPRETQSRIFKDPSKFLSLLGRVLANDQDLLILANKEHALGEKYVPRDLVSLDAKPMMVAKAGLSLRKEALEALLSMNGAARSSGIRIVAGSTYRSYSTQESVYVYWVKTLGQTRADRESARPGYSEHQLGTTIDFSPIDDSFSQTPGAPWLRQNAWKYGFVLSYPDGLQSLTGYKYEPWHFRYIGTGGAEIVEKFFGGNPYTFLRFYAENSKILREKHTP
jgi:D-alanyl-D-alanine carboxypeptidase